MTGTCSNCGAADVELDENGHCANCAAAAPATETPDGDMGGDAGSDMGGDMGGAGGDTTGGMPA